MLKFCSLFSGSSGNSLFVSKDETKILIDVGLSGKKTIEALNSIGEDLTNVSAILVTHEHIDHVRGVGILSRMKNIPIYANKLTWEAMESKIGKISNNNRKHFETGEKFSIEDISIKPFGIPHDAAEPVGFSFISENKKISTATDIGHITKDLYTNLEGSDLIFLESNHDVQMLRVGSYPWSLKQRVLGDKGHISNETAGNFITDLFQKGTKRFILGHLSRENNFPQLAYQTICNILNENNIKLDKDIFMTIASRDKVSDVIVM